MLPSKRASSPSLPKRHDTMIVINIFDQVTAAILVGLALATVAWLPVASSDV